MTAFRSCPDCRGTGKVELECQFCRGKGSIDDPLTEAEKAVIKVAARYITESAEPPSFWAMTAAEMKALKRAVDKL